ncbi:MAG: acyltransferase [Chloroflexota bacterium]|nr:acyltransferase [Chloroflexota bacterium]
MLVIAAVAAIQTWLHGGGFSHQLRANVTFGRYIHVPMDWGQIFAGLFVAPRVAREEWMFAPEAVLWFVPLLLQYYLLFPWLYRALGRIGPAPFLVATLLITVGAQAAAIWLWDEYAVPGQYGWMLAPTRLFEFSLGMTLGWLMVQHRAWLEESVRGPVAIAVAIYAGLALQVAGSGLDAAHRYYFALSSSMIVRGLTLIVLPFIVKAPARIESATPARLLAWIGAASYAVLIVNEPFRYVMSLMRNELPGAVWWPVLIVLYVPASVLLAQPLARFFGLLPVRAPVPGEPAPPAIATADASAAGAAPGT